MKRRSISFVAVAGLAVSCRQIVGVESRSSEPPVTSAAPAASSAPPAVCGLVGDDACRACIRASCCDEMTACAGDSQCGKDEDCLLACPPGDDVCRAACHAVLGDPMQKLARCEYDGCSDACGLPCGVGTAFAYSLVDVTSDCATCTAKNACAPFGLCTDSPECLAYTGCYLACPGLDRPCQKACETAYPGGRISFLLAVGRSLSCYEPCNIGGKLACLDGPIWPSVEAGGTITVDIPVYDGFANMPVPEASVTACKRLLATPCEPLGEPATTDAMHGIASVQVPVTATNAGAFSGWFHVQKAGYLDVLYVPGPPPSGDESLDIVTDIKATDAMNALSPFGFDLSKPIVVAHVADCVGLSVRGAEVALDAAAGGEIVYLREDGSFDTAGGTTSLGLAIILGVAPSETGWDASATVSVGGETKLLGKRHIPVAPGYVTYVDLVPSPR